MFSYRLRRPSQRSGQFIDNEHPPDPCHSIHDALYRDLMQLRSKYEKKMDQEIQQAKKVSPGSAFGVLKDVFRSAKVALLHAHLAPKRCDRNAHSQLLYAVCWNFLYDAFQERDNKNDSPEQCAEDIFLIRASYAIFSLYVLYETNTLPTAPVESEEEIISLLPTGLNQSVDNPGYLYRRHFKQAIRIDLNCFYYMQRLLQLAMKRGAQHYATRTGDANLMGADFGCVVAIDTVNITQRLQPYLCFCSYTGPCSLEGLAGHGNSSHSLEPEPMHLPQHMDGQMNSDRALSATDIDKKRKTYLDVCGAIRLPSTPSNPGLAAKINRVNKALEASSSLLGIIKNERSSEEQWSSLSADDGHLCSASSRTEPPDIGNLDSYGSKMNSSDVHEEGLRADVSIPLLEFVFPEGMTCQQQKSLRAAVEVLISRNNAPSIVPTSSQGSTKSVGIYPSAECEVSSYAEATVESGIGRKALHYLWGRVTGKHASATDWFAEDDLERLKETSVSHRTDDDGNHSEISLDEEEFVEVASTVGHKALSEILLRHSKRKHLDIKTGNRTGYPKKSPRITGASNECQDSGPSDVSNDEASDTSESGTGGALALATLLSVARPPSKKI